MSWLVDNATTLSILLGVIAAGFVVAWRFNQRAKFLGYACVPLVVISLLWLLTLWVPTDRKQLESNVRAMADAVSNGKVDDLFKHISNDFRYKERTRDTLYQEAQATIRLFKIKDVRVTNFNVDELSRSKKRATTSFLVAGSAGEQGFLIRLEADFALEGEQWKLTTMRRRPPMGNKDQELDLFSP